MTKIVVGVDGSAIGNEALSWAYAEAKLRGAELHLVHCWDYPYYGTMDMVGLDEKIRESSRVAAQQLLDELLAQVQAQHQDDDVLVTGETVQGGPAWSLVKVAKDADLLVVGSRGRGGFAGLLLGSISQTVVSHADVPVVVVRHHAAKAG
jgi:nucleotide-binding universal stress UspA family protein